MVVTDMYHTLSAYLIGVQRRRENTLCGQHPEKNGQFLSSPPCSLSVTAPAPLHCLRAATVMICNSIN